MDSIPQELSTRRKPMSTPRCSRRIRRRKATLQSSIRYRTVFDFTISDFHICALLIITDYNVIQKFWAKVKVYFTDVIFKYFSLIIEYALIRNRWYHVFVDSSFPQKSEAYSKHKFLHKKNYAFFQDIKVVLSGFAGMVLLSYLLLYLWLINKKAE